jgi:hypothetical protein
LVRQDAKVYLPYGHSPDVDLVADFGDQLIRVQVKTSTVVRNGRHEVTICTRGGNQSWNGVVKHFSATKCEYLFVHVSDGRRWFIPADTVEGGSKILLGGPKYEDFEIAPDLPLSVIAESRIARLADPWRGTRAVKGTRL